MHFYQLIFWNVGNIWIMRSIFMVIQFSSINILWFVKVITIIIQCLLHSQNICEIFEVYIYKISSKIFISRYFIWISLMLSIVFVCNTVTVFGYFFFVRNFRHICVENWFYWRFMNVEKMLQITEITKTFTNNTVLDITTSGKNGLSGSGNRLWKELFSFWEYFFTFKLWNKMKTNIPNEDWRNVNLEAFHKILGKKYVEKKTWCKSCKEKFVE